MLITRLNGVRAVIGQIPTGFGPMLWAGELRTDDGRVYEIRFDAGSNGHADKRGAKFCSPVRLGPATVDGLSSVLRQLREVAATPSLRVAA